MIVLKILGILLAAVLLIIFLILMLPVRVVIFTREDGSIKILYKILFLTFGRKPNPRSPILRIAKELTGLSRLSDLGTVKQSLEDSGISATAGQIVHILLLLLGRVVWLLQYCTVKRLKIDAVCGGADAAEAAMEYGAVCAVVYPLIGYVEGNMKVRQKGLDVNIGCDFGQVLGSFALETVISVRIWHVARALLHIVRRNMEEEIYKEAGNEQRRKED